jgi:hypothetical protein
VPLPHHLHRDDSEQPPLPVPVTAIYTRTDGVASWQHCLETLGPKRENIEVRGSHCGLGHNASVLAVVVDRLARARSEWQPFVPAKHESQLLSRTDVVGSRQRIRRERSDSSTARAGHDPLSDCRQGLRYCTSPIDDADVARG